MKKLMVIALLMLACGSAKAELEIYDYVVLDEIDSVNYNNNVLTVNLKGLGKDNDGSEEMVTVNGRVDSSNFSLTTSNFKRVHTYRMNREMLNKVLDLYDNLSDVE